MIDLTRNASINLPVSVEMYDLGLPQVGLSGVVLNVINSDTGEVYDQTDDEFRDDPATPNVSMSGLVAAGHHYQAELPAGAFPRGNYIARAHYSDGREFVDRFSVGLRVDRSLRVAATYSGTSLKIAAWIEEAGEAQADYTALASARLLDQEGALVTSVAFTLGANGVFHATTTVTIAAGTPLVLEALARTPKQPSGNYEFLLRCPIVRP